MDTAVLKQQVPTSPAFIIDEAKVNAALTVLTNLRENSGCKVLYSIKALPLSSVLALAKSHVDGFSVSSLFEARLAAEILAGQGAIHLTTPGIRLDEMAELLMLCSHISCNSLNQYRQLTQAAKPLASIGIRVNPKLSFTEDSRHDPCRTHSKLGVSLDDLINGGIPADVNGLQFHTVFSTTDFTPLTQTVATLRDGLGKQLAKLAWLNLGGGYLFDEIEDPGDFITLVSGLKNDFGLDVIIEPGNAVVSKAGYLLATVIDLFASDGKTVAILDTSVNHQPQVFEYQRQPDLAEHSKCGDYPVLLAGSTCLAGDLFGEYRFKQPLSVGDKLVFQNVGAYSLVKANRFNGYNLPDIYRFAEGKVELLKQTTYHDYRQYWLTEN